VKALLKPPPGRPALSRPPPAGLAVSVPGERDEREADRIADRVMGARLPLAAPVSVARGTNPAPLRAKASGAGRPRAGAGVLRAMAASTGEPLADGVRERFESRFGHDFGQVRVHRDAAARRAAQALGARAFARGPDIYFAAGQYRPESRAGGWLLAHELVHTLQGHLDRIACRADNEAGVQPPEPVDRSAADALVAELAPQLASSRDEAAVRQRLARLDPATREQVVQRLRAQLAPEPLARLDRMLGAIAEPDAGAQGGAPNSGSGETPDATPAAAAGPTIGSAAGVAADAAQGDEGTGETPGRAETPPGTPAQQATQREGETRDPATAALEAGSRGAGRQPAAPPTPGGVASPAAAAAAEEGDGGAGGLPRHTDLVEPLQAPQPDAAPAAQTPSPSVAPEAPGQLEAPAPDTTVEEALAALTVGSVEARERVGERARSAAGRIRALARRIGARVQGRVRSARARLARRFGRQRRQLAATLDGALRQLQTSHSTRVAEARTTATRVRGELTGIFTGHRRAIAGVVSGNLRAARTLQRNFTASARRRSNSQAARARRMGRRKAAGYPNNRRGWVQSRAARGVANRVAGEIERRLPETLGAIAEVTADIPGEFRGRGAEALRGFDRGLPQLLQGVDRRIAEVIRQMAQQHRQALTRLRALRERAMTDLRAAEQAAMGRLAAIAPPVVAQIERGKQGALRHLRRAARRTDGTIARVTEEAAVLLAGDAEAQPGPARRFADAVLNWINGMADETVTAMDGAVRGVAPRLQRAVSLTRRQTAAIERRTDALLNRGAATVSRSVTALAAGVDRGYATLLRNAGRLFDATKARVRQRLQPAVTGLRTRFAATLRRTEARIRAGVNRGLAKNDEALGRLDGRMTQAANDAAWDHDHPVLATLRDIGTIVLGVIVGILAVLAIVVAVIVLIKVGAFVLAAAGLSVATAALVAKIVVIGGLLAAAAYQGYQSYRAYRAAGQGAGGALLNVARDFTGISHIQRAFSDDPNLTPYQRGRAFGTGATILVLSFLGGRSLIARFRGRVPPRIPNPRQLPPGASRWARARLASELAAPLPRVRLPRLRRAAPQPAPQAGAGSGTQAAAPVPATEPQIGFGRQQVPRMDPSRVVVEGYPQEPTIGFGRQQVPRHAPLRMVVEGPPQEPTIGFGRQQVPRMDPSRVAVEGYPQEPTIGFGRTPMPRHAPLRVVVEGPPQEPTIGFGRQQVPRTHPSRVAVEGPPHEPTIGFGRPKVPRTDPSRVAVEGPPQEPTIGFGRTPGARQRPVPAPDAPGPQAGARTPQRIPDARAQSGNRVQTAPADRPPPTIRASGRGRGAGGGPQRPAAGGSSSEIPTRELPAARPHQQAGGTGTQRPTAEPPAARPQRPAAGGSRSETPTREMPAVRPRQQSATGSGADRSSRPTPAIRPQRPAARSETPTGEHPAAGRGGLIDSSTPDYYRVRDPAHPRFAVSASVENGELQFVMRTRIQGGPRSALLRGHEQFQRVLAHFRGSFRAIRGSWSYGDNLAEFNRLTGRGVSPQEAATQTWTGRQAGQAGYTRAVINPRGTEGTPGNYTKVSVTFERPS
jgi:hypothetical protein